MIDDFDDYDSELLLCFGFDAFNNPATLKKGFFKVVEIEKDSSFVAAIYRDGALYELVLRIRKAGDNDYAYDETSETIPELSKLKERLDEVIRVERVKRLLNPENYTKTIRPKDYK